MQGGNCMIHTHSGILAIEGDYSEVLADVMLIIDNFTSLTNEANEECGEETINNILCCCFEQFPETITDFTKLFVKATH